MELRPPLHLGVVAIEKGAFGSPATKVANFTLQHFEKEEENNFFVTKFYVVLLVGSVGFFMVYEHLWLILWQILFIYIYIYIYIYNI